MRTLLTLAVLLLALAPVAHAADVPPECPSPVDVEVEDSGEGVVLDLEELCGEPVALTVIYEPFFGEITLAGASVTYAVDIGFVSSDSFVVAATNAGMESTMVEVYVEIVPPAGNRAPTCQTPPPLTTPRDAPIVLDGDLDPRPGCTDPDGDVIGYAPVTGPGHGTLTFPPITYTPAPGYVGTDVIGNSTREVRMLTIRR